MSMVFCAETSGEAFDGRSQKRSRLEMDAGVSLWAGLQSDVLGMVLCFLPCLADRTSMLSVCRQWHATSRDHVLLPPRHPLLVLPQLRFSCFCSGAALTASLRAWMPEDVEANDVRFVGSFKGWLVGVTPSKDHSSRGFDGECFMVNLFSHKVLRLPPLIKRLHHGFSGYSRKALPIINGSGEVNFTTNNIYKMSLRRVVLSAAPDSGSKCIVVASSYHTITQTLALWQPGMISWQVCDGLAGPKDLVFYQGKLYVLSRFLVRLYIFELEEDERGVIVSRVEHCVTTLLHNHHIRPGDVLSNMVVWRGKLLLIIRRYDTSSLRRALCEVEVFALDFSTNPYGCTTIHSFEGDCIFVDSCSCSSLSAGLYDGAEGDLIYFVDQYSKYDGNSFKPSYDTFVYNMRDGTTRPFAVELSPHNFGAPKDKLAVPLWLSPLA
ncbi:hypothetical protein EJB05_54198 [Eragrostis curvula]|uniref:KIB1-4 beta-propeller domain-containing protein n=1 Tax=Eragrostis curvula TaxID=38414 RepID=A0A5J9SN69_9POAL|nr:hypothetical protein EJB05_54198 [Eragrostis curvula]